jgi:hypothetical protein
VRPEASGRHGAGEAANNPETEIVDRCKDPSAPSEALVQHRTEPGGRLSVRDPVLADAW